MADFLPPTLPEMIKEAERELALRRRVYPAHIARKRLTQEKADRQIQIMQAIVTTLARLPPER